ncbi:MAG TPA: S8 family peptidase [Epulopiscium sp.]|nr:S8 family peptidase [Candidatus Epulonipiscium sp.]
MARYIGKLRSLEIADQFLERDEVIDVIVTFNNVNMKMPVTVNQTTIAYPPQNPYIGIRGTLEGITKNLNEFSSDFTTVTLAPVLGIEPLNITPADFKPTSILKQPQEFKGKGTLIGILNTGIDYTNPAFIDANGETRIEAIWDQTIGNESIYGYGTIYNKEMINKALQNPDPFSVVPHKDEWGEGTMLAGIAAGAAVYKNGEYTGVATEAELVVVKLRPAPLALQKIFHTIYNPLGFSGLDVALGVQYIGNVAAQLQKPISVCFPIGGNTGPHDGSEALTNILGTYGVNRGITIVLAAGDEANKGNHASGDLKQNPLQQVKLVIPKGQKGFLIEIWVAFGDKIEVSIVHPGAVASMGSSVSIILLNEPQNYKFNDNSYVWTEGSVIDPESGCQLIRFRLDNPAQGDWTLSIRGITIINGFYNIWIPKAGMLLPGTILSPSSPFVTIYNSSSSEKVITVACYDKAASSPCGSSGRGLTRDNRVKPDFLVEGVNIPAPLPDNKFGYITGTAPSGAITAGICANLYEMQRKQKVNLFNTPMMKAMLVQQLTREETISYPSPSRGYGILDINTFYINK